MQLTFIQQKIFTVRGQKIMLDKDLADIYEVETRALKQSVNRNKDRFPTDFMFQLTNQEVDQLVSQDVIPSKSYFGGSLPYAFTEHGVTMLASVLRSEKAVKMNIAIIRAFIALREMALNYKELSQKLNDLEKKYDSQFKEVFDILKNMLVIDRNQQEQKILRKGLKD
ncbi:MAG: ORF6N domain-containing protein [Flavisolibacter sp.]